MVSIGTFEWSSISHLKHMPKQDAFIVVTVTIITIFADLGVAVLAGVIISVRHLLLSISKMRELWMQVV